jgi:hypothetical protein
MDLLRAYPHMVKEGDVPCYLLHENLNEEISQIQPKIGKRLEEEFKEKKYFPTIKHV